MENDPQKFLTDEEVADRLNLSVQTLRNWRCIGKGLPYVKFGRSIRYKNGDIEAFSEANRVIPRQ
jgi:excisionase family DNA binding protein